MLIRALVFLGILCPAMAQDLAAKLSREQAVHDVETLVAFLESAHPDPYINGGGKIAFKRRADALLRAIPAEGLTVRELGDRLVPFLAVLKDGHTSLSYSTDRWRDPAWWLPIRFQAASDGLFISAFDAPELDGARGWRLLGANGVPLDRLLALRAADSNAENRYGALHSFGNVLVSLKFMNNLLGNATAEGAVTYQLESPDGKREDRVVPWSARRKWDPAKARASLVVWESLDRSPELFPTQFFDRPSAALLRLPTIMPREAYEIAIHSNPASGRQMLERYYQNRKQPMPSDLAEAIRGVPSLLDTSRRLLEQMKERRTPALIVDLRGNSGGWTPSVEPFLQALYGDSLYARSRPGEWVRVESPLYLAKLGQTVEDRRRADPAFRPGRYIFSNDVDTRPAEIQRRELIRRYEAAGYSFAAALAALDGSAVYTPKRVVVLCDPGTFSAAFHLMVCLRHMGAKIVGVPSSQSPNAFMEMTDFTLPESKLSGSISNSAQVFAPADLLQRVLEPDFPVTIDVYRRYGCDTEAPLRYALDLLAAGKLQ